MNHPAAFLGHAFGIPAELLSFTQLLRFVAVVFFGQRKQHGWSLRRPCFGWSIAWCLPILMEEYRPNARESVGMSKTWEKHDFRAESKWIWIWENQAKSLVIFGMPSQDHTLASGRLTFRTFFTTQLQLEMVGTCWNTTPSFWNASHMFFT